jgi:hypothetical protein
VDELTTTTGIVALAAGAVALIALVSVIVLARRLAKLRADQRVVLGERDARDLVGHAATLDRDFRSLQSYVADLADGLQGRLAPAEERLDGRGSGVVVSSIHHRDQARLYAKQVVDGQGTLELSPEEQEAVRVALAGEVPDRAEQRR